MLGMLNNGVLTLMTSIGHRPRLFDTITSSPVHTRANRCRSDLHKRYGHECWHQVTAGVVAVDPASTRFVLPAEW